MFVSLLWVKLATAVDVVTTRLALGPALEETLEHELNPFTRAILATWGWGPYILARFGLTACIPLIIYFKLRKPNTKKQKKEEDQILLAVIILAIILTFVCANNISWIKLLN